MASSGVLIDESVHGDKLFKLSKGKYCSVSVYNQSIYIGIRSFYDRNYGEMGTGVELAPSKHGVSLDEQGWERLMNARDQISEEKQRCKEDIENEDPWAQEREKTMENFRFKQGILKKKRLADEEENRKTRRLPLEELKPAGFYKPKFTDQD